MIASGDCILIIIRGFVYCKQPKLSLKFEVMFSSNYSSDDEETEFVPRALFSPEASSEILEVQSAPSKKRFRGKALPWELIRGNPTFASLEEVLKDAVASNMSKVGTKQLMHRFSCRETKCKFLSEYRYSREDVYVLYTCFSHVHSSGSEDDDEKIRGLSLSQIALVQEAFDLKNTAARPILEYFRDRRHHIYDATELALFPPDSERSKLNYLIQKLKKQKGYVIYPTSRLLKKWCDDHGTTTVDINNESSLNTPFILRYKLVRL